MAVDYKRYLAENVLSERRVVTHRLLSRALRVHSNLAKQMLFDFHKTENEKKPNSVTATYLISGVQRPQRTRARNGNPNDGEDTVMRSSPYMSSMPQPDESDSSTYPKSFLLAREEDLEEAKDTFESVSMIHIYSLQSNELPDLNALVDVSREILTSFGSEDPLELGKQWGMIQNQNVKRRKTGKPPVPVVTSAPAKAAAPIKDISKKEVAQSKAGPEVVSTESSQTKATEKAPPRRKGDLFSSFANAKPKLKKEDSAASSGKSAAENVSKKGMFDDDDDDAEEAEDADPFSNSKESVPISNRESRKEREAKLKQMMEDDDDEDMPDATETPVESVAEESAAEESQQTEPQQAPEPEPKETVTIQGGRRRGKRKIMKKKTVKDDEGYLVTVEEPAWESFSEDEPAPPPKKKAAISAAGKKAGQGNIMSFFSKK